jgi:hypothetical protein
VPTYANGTTGGAVTVSVKRASATECAYEVDVTTAIGTQADSTLTFSGLWLQNHSLATEGNTESVSVGVWDLGETARIDNSADLTNVVAKSWRAVTLIANQDTGTTADVNFNSGNSPLFGFVASGADTATAAEANFIVNSNGTTTNAAGTAFNAHVDLTKITFTVTGDYDGLDTNFVAANSVATVNQVAVAGAGVTVAGSGASTTVTFNGVSTSFNATGNTVMNLKLATLATKSLGTTRTFGVSAVVDPSLPGVADQSLSGNSSWWVWGANAIELRTAFFNNADDFARFFFQNTGAVATYSAVCYGEPTAAAPTTVTYGGKKSGSLATGTTMIVAKDVCTFATAAGANVTRGSVVFTITAAAGKVKGVYQQAVNGLSAGYIALERPYGNNNTSNGSNF